MCIRDRFMPMSLDGHTLFTLLLRIYKYNQLFYVCIRIKKQEPMLCLRRTNTIKGRRISGRYGKLIEPFMKCVDGMYKSQVVLWNVPVLAGVSEQRRLVSVRLCGVGILR